MDKTIGMILAFSCTITFAQTVSTPTGVQKIGSVNLSRSESKISVGTGAPVESTQDQLIGGFAMYDYTNYVPPQLPPPTTIGPCFVATSSGMTTVTRPNIVITPLDAGPLLNVTGPNGTQQAPKIMSTLTTVPSAYSGMLGGGIPLPPLPFPIPGLSGPKPLWLDPGDYTIDNGSGGADIGPFSATITLPAALVWTNADSSLTITRSAGVDLLWTGGDPNAMVEIQGVVSSAAIGSGAFTCIVPNTGEFMVTSDVLNLMPATPTPAGPGVQSLLTVSTGGQTNFTAPGLDTAVLSYGSGATRQVVYQ